MIREQVFKQLSVLPFAPSVQMHEVPNESLGEHLGMTPMVLEANRDQESEEMDKKLGSKRLSRVRICSMFDHDKL